MSDTNHTVTGKIVHKVQLGKEPTGDESFRIIERVGDSEWSCTCGAEFQTDKEARDHLWEVDTGTNHQEASDDG